MTAHANSPFFHLSATVLVIFFAARFGFSQTTPIELRYKLAQGDRLVYSEVFEKEGTSPDAFFKAQMVLSNQVVVLDAVAGKSLIGIQRNRQSAELVESREHGKSTLALQKPGFEQRMAARPVHFADSNLFSATGQAQLPLEVFREANSKLLYRIAEIMPLPVTPVQVGSEWDPGILGLRMKLERFEPVGDESCAVFADTGSRKETHLHFTFCPASGHLAKLEFDGQYAEIDSTIHEKVTLELQFVHHQEAPTSWLANPETQQGALTAYLDSVLPLPDSPIIDQILREGPPNAQSSLLAAYYQRGLAPNPDVLQPLLKSNDTEVRRIAGRFHQPAATPAAQPCELTVVRHSREKPGTTLRGMSTKAFSGQPYMIHVPLDYRGDQPFSLIIYLSGGGGLAFDAALNTGNAIKHAGYLILMPHAGGELWWQPQTTEMVHALLLEILRSYNVDTNRVYLAGFSNGGTAALEFGTRWPDRFAALASLMGAGSNSPSGTKLPMQNLLDVPVLFLHGDKDPRIPFPNSVNTFDELRDLKPRVPPEVHLLKGRAHDVTLNADDGFTLPFFERFTRDSFPQSVSAKIWDARFQRQYWIEVVEGDNAPSEVEGSILPNNLIEIKTRNVKKLRLLLRPELFHDAGPIHIRLNGKDQPAVELKRDCQLFAQSAETYADPFLAYTDEVVLDVPK
jgi:pimeloyl-ACP methyl ester carboxylesterase